MNQAIKEAARQSAEKAMRASCDRQKTWGEIVKVYENLFLDGVKHIQSLPLVKRLTEEEKEKIRLYHGLARDGYWECNCANKAVVRVLESIFGKELFE